MGISVARLGSAVALAALATGCASTSDGAATRHGGDRRAVVTRVVDGDTIDVRVGGRETTVRILQIDAPESSATRYGHPDRCGARATAFGHTLARPGTTVTLQYAGSDRTDHYGRTLALVHLGGSGAVTWEERMVRAGWASVYVVGGNTTPLLATLRVDARDARTHRRGVWRYCDGRVHDDGRGS